MALGPDPFDGVFERFNTLAVARDEKVHKLASVMPNFGQHSVVRKSLNRRRCIVNHFDQFAGATIIAALREAIHEQVRLGEEKLKEKDERLGEKDAKIAVMEQEIKDLRLQLDQKGANVKAALAPRPSLFVSVQGGEKQKLADVLVGKDGDKVLDTFILGSSAQIFVMNLVCVRKGEWLNSETINVYVLMIEDAARRAGHNVTSFNSYFVSKIETEVTCDV